MFNIIGLFKRVFSLLQLVQIAGQVKNKLVTYE